MPVPSRPSSPDPWPRQPQASGALYGTLPIALPKKDSRSADVVIVFRKDGVTEFLVRCLGDKKPLRCKIDTSNEWILAAGVRVVRTGSIRKPRLVCGRVIVARLVVQQRPSPDPERVYVDHADGDSLNDTAENLHWVDPAFNAWNRERKARDDYLGVHRSGKSTITVLFRKINQCSYDNAETAARVYDLVVRLAYGDQVDKTPRLLNNLPDHEKQVVKVELQADGVDIYRVDHYHIVVYDGTVQSNHKTLGDAKRAGKNFVSDMEKKQAGKKKWAKERKRLVAANAITRNADKVAYMPLELTKTNWVEVLLDDETWLDLVSTGATLTSSFNARPSVRYDGRLHFLSRFLRPAGFDIVDHVNGNVLDHRLENLKVMDRSANAQNAWRGTWRFMGVHACSTGGWRVTVNVKDQRRVVSKAFATDELEKAVAFYDLTALHQHGPCAWVNCPENFQEYLKALELDKTRKLIEEFLQPKAKIRTSLLFGVSIAAKGFVGTAKQMETQKVKHTKPFLNEDGGAEVKAGIFADMWKLKINGTQWRVNFEFMRPWHIFHLPQLKEDIEDEIVDKAYKRMGGDDFDRERKLAVAPPPLASLASPSQAAASSPSAQPSLPSTSGKRKRDE